MAQGVCGIDGNIVLRDARPPDQRCGQTLRAFDIVKAEPAFDTQAALVGRAVTALYPDNFVVLDMKGQLTADAAIGADGCDVPIGCNLTRAGQQCAGGTDPHAFTATDTAAVAHGIIEIEGDVTARAPSGHGDDVIDLNFPAGLNA